MDRRHFIASAAAGTAALAAPLRVAAQPAAGLQATRLLELARAQIERAGAVLWRRDIAGIVDFGLHSSYPRLHIVNLEAGTVESLLVSHGAGSDPEHDGWLNGFSNLSNSWATSRGAYVTWEWYQGRFGTSMRLEGLEESNSNAFPRAIVMHQAPYASPDHVARWGRCGRSNGCFAIGPEVFGRALYLLAGGRLLFADTLGIGPNGDDVPMPPQAPVDFATLAAQNRARAAEGEAASGAAAAPDGFS